LLTGISPEFLVPISDCHSLKGLDLQLAGSSTSPFKVLVSVTGLKSLTTLRMVDANSKGRTPTLYNVKGWPPALKHLEVSDFFACGGNNFMIPEAGFPQTLESLAICRGKTEAPTRKLPLQLSTALQIRSLEFTPPRTRTPSIHDVSPIFVADLRCLLLEAASYPPTRRVSFCFRWTRSNALADLKDVPSAHQAQAEYQ
jgi:hypothetical protein